MASKVTFKIKLSDIVDTSNLSPRTKKELRDEVSEFVIDKILSDTSKQQSSVSGRKWKGLDKKSSYYKEKMKIAPGKANLELHGDMLDALKEGGKGDVLEIGIFDKDQAKKADGHCHTGVFGTSELPKRQFIPGRGQKLRPGIMKEVVKIAKDIVENAPETIKRKEKQAEARKAALALLKGAVDDQDQN